jgi:hypothetical protein
MTSHHFRGGSGARARIRSSRMAFTSASGMAPNAVPASLPVAP